MAKTKIAETSKATSFLGFINEIEGLELFSDLVVFRGQSVRGDLLPAVARKDPLVDTTDQEGEVLEQLKLQGAPFLPSGEQTDLDLLVLAQHFGLKTRLLDWTSNPLAALWFACADPAGGDVYVYALEADTLTEKDAYTKDPFSRAKTRIFQPRFNNPRIVAQHGWFTLHRYAKKNGRFVPLEKNPEIAKYIHEYKIPEGSRKEILSSLDRHGINAKTVYPDLGGLCQYLNWKEKLI